MANREIPQRELRNNVSAVLREVEAGATLRVTVRGRPVADLVPVPKKRRWIPREEVLEMLRDSPLDSRFEADVNAALGMTTDEL